MADIGGPIKRRKVVPLEEEPLKAPEREPGEPIIVPEKKKEPV